MRNGVRHQFQWKSRASFARSASQRQMVSTVLQLQIEDVERCWNKTCGTLKTAESFPNHFGA